MHCTLCYLAGGFVHDISVYAVMSVSSFYRAVWCGIDAINSCPSFAIKCPSKGWRPYQMCKQVWKPHFSWTHPWLCQSHRWAYLSDLSPFTKWMSKDTSIKLSMITFIFTSNGKGWHRSEKITSIRWNLSFSMNLMADFPSSVGNELANAGCKCKKMFSNKCVTITSFVPSWDKLFTR
jgi:hypothetical protein